MLNTIVTKECRYCHRESDISVDINDLYAWKKGTPIQWAFPYLSPDEREMILTDICGDCWDKMIGSDEDE